jgi:2-succinyl-6-hydroxy-2,4-cyclohexadiene-1-carboxylate synthase
LLLLHGFTGSTETWEPLRAVLERSFTVIAIDLPGHGWSESPTDPARFALPRLAGDLAVVLDTLGFLRTAVLGYSMGGRAVIQFALQHPDRVAALVLESASPGIADDAERAARVASDTKLAESIERDGIEAFVDRWEKLPLWASQASVPDEIRARLRRQRLANLPAGLANSLRGAGAGEEPSTLDRLTELRASVLLIAGGLDPKYMTLSRIMMERLPDARLEIVEGAGHAVHLERPLEFGGAVECFLDGVASEAGQWR